MKKETTFEDYLMEVHCRENPEILDDDLPDRFYDWLAEIDVDDLVKYGDEFVAQERKKLDLCNKCKFKNN